MARHDDTRARSQEAEQEEAARYRIAADEALAQLDWCVNYLHRIRKPRIAEAIEKNCTSIRRQASRTNGDRGP